MSSYVKNTDFASKDALLSGDPAKIIKGTEIDTEFNAISVAVSTKADLVSPTFTGTPLAPTAAPGTNTSQVATTAFAAAANTAERTATATLTNKTLTSPTINGGTISGITDLTVADGGTGVSALTADNVILGDGTNPVKFVAPSTSGNVLTSNGTTWASAAPTSGSNGQVFTSNGTFTIPTGTTRIKVTVVGGGGGGCDGGGFGQNATRGAGGGGGTAIKYLTGLTPGNTLAVTIGAGGTTNTQPGGNGGNSTVASGTQSITTITGGGGVGGQISTNTDGGAGTNGDINIPGGTGLYGGLGGETTYGGGSGAGAFAQAGKLYGGGGTSQFNAIGAVGAAGVVIFEW